MADSGRVGDPNVLTGAATPNVLSSQVGGSPSPVTTPQVLAPRPAAPQRLAQPRPAQPFDDAARPRSRPRLSISTVIFLAFAAFTVLRFIGQVADQDSGTALPTTPPRPPVTSTAPGPITFGPVQEDCSINDAAATFEAGTEVRWVAVLSTSQAPEASVTVLYYHDDIRFNREDVPPDPSVGTWDTLCSGDPIAETTAGRYIVEIWNESSTVLLARGIYDVTPN